jgi:CheY-like chemotaxis protein
MGGGMGGVQPCKRVLVVDDERDIQEAIGELLGDYDYTALAASNGRDALEQLRAMEEKPCVILLDLKMPVMNGFEFRIAQRADPRLEAIPVIIVTANFLASEVVDLDPAGFVQKPLDANVLLEIVSATCSAASANEARWSSVAEHPARWERPGFGAVEARGASLWAALPTCGHDYYIADDLAEAQRRLDLHWGLCFACWYRGLAFRRALRRGRTTPPGGTAAD